jgi:phosphatidylglycerol:prolipoprotein diacylglycerol transferase
MISITPHTEIFSSLGYSVQTWGTIVAIGIIIALSLMFRKAMEKKLFEKSQILITYFMISAIIGGRIAYILVNPNEFSTLGSLFEIWKGGIISYGVLLGGIFGVIIYKITSKAKNADIKNILDLMAPYFVLAIAIGRIGCFLRGCCFGIPTTLPWGIIYGPGSEAFKAGLAGAVHPTQIYHAILDFLIFFALLKVNKKKDNLQAKGIESKFKFFSKKGSTFLLFLMLYSMERFFVDFLRYHPSTEYIGMISITQIVFMLIFATAFWLITKKSPGDFRATRD